RGSPKPSPLCALRDLWGSILAPDVKCSRHGAAVVGPWPGLLYTRNNRVGIGTGVTMSAPNVPYPRYPAPARMARPPRRHMNPWVIRLALLGVTGLILLFFTLLVLVSGYQFVHQDEIYPGVSTVLDVDLAGMTRQEAIAALSERFTYADE